MGIGKDDKYELILSPNGNRFKLLALDYWHRQAPGTLLKNWNFYSSKPSSRMIHVDDPMGIGEIAVAANDIEIVYELNDKIQRFDLLVFCPMFVGLEEEKKYKILLLMLDLCIGELSTMEYIGYIDFVDTKPLESTIRLGELRDQIEQTIQENGWSNAENLLAQYYGYKLEPSKGENCQFREDIFVGSTAYILLINAY